MQFQVPQFTEIEDKVIGPLTLKQFLYLLVAGVSIFILYKLFNLYVVILFSVPILCLAIALGFAKINNQPFISVIKNFFGFLRKPDFYIWKKSTNIKPEEKENIEIIQKTSAKTKTKPIGKEHLQEMGWKVEIEK